MASLNISEFHRRVSRFAAWLLCLLVLATPVLADDEIASRDRAEPERQIDGNFQEGMTQERMAAIIEEYAGGVTGPPNQLLFVYEGFDLSVVSDKSTNRMRILTPVVPVSELTQEQIVNILVSNYHLALDARYAFGGGGLLYSVYIHPLQELTVDQLHSAIRQVTSLRSTFGTTYTSGELIFGAPRQQGEDI